jgi:hypothetical protein
VRYRFVREYEASSAFFDAVCTSLGDAPAACGEHLTRIGDPRLAMRQAWLANAPTAIGESGVTLADGRHVAFQLDGAPIEHMAVTLHHPVVLGTNCRGTGSAAGLELRRSADGALRTHAPAGCAETGVNRPFNAAGRSIQALGGQTKSGRSAA